MPTCRLITACALLFLTSALISICIRSSSSHYKSYHWPLIFSPSSGSASGDYSNYNRRHRRPDSSTYENVAFATFLSGTADPPENDLSEEEREKQDTAFWDRWENADHEGKHNVSNDVKFEWITAPSFYTQYSTTEDHSQYPPPNTVNATDDDLENFPTPEQTLQDEANDGYFLSTRVLTYSLLHHPISGSNNSIPFLVLVTPRVSVHKRLRLAADGATVILVPSLPLPSWVKNHGIGADRWVSVFGKLRLWQLVDYKKICFIDADMLVTERLDGIFDDPATDTVRTRREEDAVIEDEAQMPSEYIFGGKPEAFGYDHDVPPQTSEYRKASYFNSGFFVLKPSTQMLNYYISLLRIPDKFDPGFPDQNLLNYAHRRGGNMPWRLLGWKWNMNWPTLKDLEAGARSFHAKYWDEGDESHDKKLIRIWQGRRDEMRGFFRGREKGRVEGLEIGEFGSA